MKDIPAIKGRHLIARLIAEGEHEHQDFKFRISDARKIARSISAFANNDGGRLLIGVKDNGVAAGISNEEDIYVVETAAQIYCRPAIEVNFTAYKTDPGIVIVKADITSSATKPICVSEDGGELRAYYRVADENIVAPAELVAAWQLSNSDTAIIFGRNHTLLLNLIRLHGSVTLQQFITASHLPTFAATHVAAELIATNSIRPIFIHRAWHLTIP